MSSSDPQKVAADVEKELTQLMESLLPPQPAQRPKGQRRFRFAVGMLCLAPFCLVVAFLIFPSSMYVDRLMWIGFALTLLVIGAWQLDKSSKEADSSTSSVDDQALSDEVHKNVHPLRRKR